MRTAPLSVLLLLTLPAGLAGQTAAKLSPSPCRGPVCVEMGVPSIWSLQQAHYLLERNRALNRSLRAKPLGELDPNAANSSRVDLLRRYLGVAGEFDQKTLLDNRLASATRAQETFAKGDLDARVRALRAQRDQLTQQRLDTEFDLTVLRSQPKPDAVEVATKEAEITRLAGQVSLLNQQITELGTASVSARSLTSTSASATPALPTPQMKLDDLLKPLVGKEAALASSTLLDNHLAQQYEIIAKQLTLLRDEAGPNRSVLFLELPQSIYTANSGGNNYIVRTRWKVKGLFTEVPSLDSNGGAPNQRPSADICQILALTRYRPKMADPIAGGCLESALQRQLEFLSYGSPDGSIVGWVHLLGALSQNGLWDPALREFVGPYSQKLPVLLHTLKKLELWTGDTDEFLTQLKAFRAGAPSKNLFEYLLRLLATQELKLHRLQDSGLGQLLAGYLAGEVTPAEMESLLAILQLLEQRQGKPAEILELLKSFQVLAKEPDLAAELRTAMLTAGIAITPEQARQLVAVLKVLAARQPGEAEWAASLRGVLTASGLSLSESQVRTVMEKVKALVAGGKLESKPDPVGGMLSPQQRIALANLLEQYRDGKLNSTEALSMMMENLSPTRVKLPAILRAGKAGFTIESFVKATISQAAGEIYAAKVHEKNPCLPDKFEALRKLRGMLQAGQAGAASDIVGIAGEENRKCSDWNSKTLAEKLRDLNTSGSEAFFEVFGPLITQYAYSENHESLAKSVELIPAKTYLNVNDIQHAVRHTNLLFLLKTVLGLGMRLDYQTQREQFETFMSQDVYAAAMGKGTDSFGWVFGPEPGRKHINPGTRTTYAVIWVPSDARAIQIDREYCYFKKDSLFTDDNCYQVPKSEAFLAIPHANEGFFLHSVAYSPVKVGGSAMVYLYGQDFSPQLGVIVNGQPLARALAITDPTLAAEHKLPPPAAPPAGVKYWGEYEVVNSRTVVLKISSSADAPPGVPEIALVAPGNALTLNTHSTTVNGARRVLLGDVAGTKGPEPMFKPSFHLAAAKFVERRSGKVKVSLAGGPFARTDEITVNGTRILPAAIQEISKTSRGIEFSRPAGFSWTISVTHFGDEEITESATVLDPLPPERGAITQQRVPGVDGKPDTLLVTVNGNFFYSLRTPVVKGGDSAAAFPKTVNAEFAVATDGKSMVMTIVDPPAFLQLSFKPVDGDADAPSMWPHAFPALAKAVVTAEEKAKAAAAAKLIQAAKAAALRTLLSEQVLQETVAREELAAATAKTAAEAVTAHAKELEEAKKAAAGETNAEKKKVAEARVLAINKKLAQAQQTSAQCTLLAASATKAKLLAQDAVKAAKAAEEVAVARVKDAGAK